MTGTTDSAIAVQPGALLATAPAATPIEQLSAALAPHGLWLPICPLTPGLRLADLVRHNAGGRYRLAHGPIGRYLRAATIAAGATGDLTKDRFGEGQACSAPPPPLTLGGPTIKRSTGLGLHRAIAGGAIDLGAPAELTFSLRPLPPARSALLLGCAGLAAACDLAAGLLRRGLALSALALAEDADGGGSLLADLAGSAAVVERQRAELVAAAQLAGAAAAPADAAAWARWEALARAQLDAPLALELTLPRAALPAYIDAARAAAARYGRDITCWGDAGVGALYLRLAGEPDAAGERCLAALAALARAGGGDLSTELGRSIQTVFPSPLPRRSERGGAGG